MCLKILELRNKSKKRGENEKKRQRRTPTAGVLTKAEGRIVITFSFGRILRPSVDHWSLVTQSLKRGGRNVKRD